jgi:hypothetical protein
MATTPRIGHVSNHPASELKIDGDQAAHSARYFYGIVIALYALVISSGVGWARRLRGAEGLGRRT